MATAVIGICAALERARHGDWDEHTDLLPRAYTMAVQRAGGLALLLPVQATLRDKPDLALDRIDALIVAGGADVDPTTYGAAPHRRTGPTCPQRDAAEIALARRAMEREMPVLGICRGMQLLNAVFGGSLVQHVPDLVGDDSHGSVPGAFSDHWVRLAPGSLAARAAGQARHAIKSHHHQAIDRLGEGLTISGWSDRDGLPEAIELADDRNYVLGVQWHPEVDPQSTVVASLVAAAKTGQR